MSLDMHTLVDAYLHFDEAFHSLDLGLAEGSSVLGTDIRPHCQVGRLVCCLHPNTHIHTYKIGKPFVSYVYV